MSHINKLSAHTTNNKKRARTTSFAFIIAALLLTLLSYIGPIAGVFGAARGLVGTLTSPFAALGTLIIKPFDNAASFLSQAGTSPQTLADLKRENEQLKAENMSLQESLAEYEDQQELVKFKDQFALNGTPALIIGRSTDAITSSITINKGLQDGLSAGMPVTSSASVIGQVSSVGPATATVRLITDERSSISALDQQSRTIGQLEGNGTDELSFAMVPSNQQINVGDQLVTSGLGGVYPKGLPLGTVSGVDKPQGSDYQDITVRPVVSISSFDEVFVVTSLTPDQRAQKNEYTTVQPSSYTGGDSYKMPYLRSVVSCHLQTALYTRTQESCRVTL